MRPIQDWLEDYGASHQHPTNKRIHWVCVPAIYFSIVGLLGCIPTGAIPILGGAPAWVDLGSLGLLLPLAWYARLSLPIFFGMVPFSLAVAAGCLLIEGQAALSAFHTHATIFAVAGVFQFIGHKIEGKKPSFFKDVQFLLVGPAWLLSFIYQRLGIPH